jgi:hypothetical protein
MAMNFFSAPKSRFFLTTFLMTMSFLTKAELIFEENFDDQPDFTSTMYDTKAGQEVWYGYTLPDNWDALFQDTERSPELGYPGNHASFEILAANTDKIRGGTGKSMVNWREAYQSRKWASDSQLMTIFDQEYNEIYVEFWVRFSDNWYSRANIGTVTSKIFRVGHYTGPPGNPVSGYSGDLGPIYIVDYNHSNYGLKINHTFRGGPPGENYYIKYEDYGLTDRFNFTSETIGMAVGGGSPQLVDQVNGGILADIGLYDFLSHDQLFGSTERWTKLAWYLKMNSAPGVADGVQMMWVNDERVAVVETVPWVGTNTEDRMVGWNYIAIGGNDFFNVVPDGPFFEDWYAIDDLTVRTSIPKNLFFEKLSAPNPPVGIGIQ